VPIYDYACSNCGRVTEVIHGIYAPGPKFCPECGAEGTMRKALSTPAIVFKGSGWAKVDRRASSTSSGARSSKSHSADSGGSSGSGESGESKGSGDQRGSGGSGDGGSADGGTGGKKSGEGSGGSGSGSASDASSGGDSGRSKAATPRSDD
jgi:putative FmdB family regulatory protein